MRLLLFSPCFLPALILLLALNWIGPTRRPSIPIDPDRVAVVEGRISSSVQPAEDYLYFELSPRLVEQAGAAIPYPGNLAIYVQHPDEAASRLRFGDWVRTIAYLREPNYYAVPGVPDHREVLWQRGVLHTVRLKSIRQLERLPAGPPGLRNLLFRYRASFEQRLELIPTGPRRLLRSAFLGDRRMLEQSDRALIRRLGVLHLFVVSGFHVSLVVLLAYSLTKRAGWTGKLLALAAGWSYVVLTGGPIATVRAGVMTSLYFGLSSAGLAPRLLNSLGITTLALGGYLPDSINTPGFHFSFLALTVIGAILEPLAAWVRSAKNGLLLAFSPQTSVDRNPLSMLQRRVRFAWEDWTEFLPCRLRRLLALGLAVPVCYLVSIAVGSLLIQLGTLPLSLFYSNLLVSSQPMNNLLLVPAFSFLIALALAWFAGFWVPSLGNLLGALATGWAAQVWDWMHRLDSVGEWFFLPHPGYWQGALYLGGYVLACWLCRRWLASVLLFLPAVVLVAVLWLGGGAAPSALSVTFLDVGQGESIHLAYPDGSHALVDCGGLRLAQQGSDFVGRALVGRYLWSLGQRRLDLILLSHPHADHIQGLEFLLPVFHPAQIFHFQPDPRYAPADRFERLELGRAFVLGGVHHEVLHPSRTDRSSTNNASLVVLLRYGHFSLLLTGDIEKEAEADLLDLGNLLPATVLKVPHHGAATSSSLPFLQSASPRLAVISAGRHNPFGHPASTVLGRLGELGIPILTTARNGTIRITTDGFRWKTQTYDIERGDWLLEFSR